MGSLWSDVRVCSMVAIVFACVAWSSPARAWWTFPADQGYIRSIDTPNWFWTYDGDPNYSYYVPATEDVPNVMQVGTGDYWAQFPGLGLRDSAAGSVQVVALGTGSERCKVWFWQLDSDSDLISVRVHCYDSSGWPANSLFTLSYVRRDDYGFPGPETAYLLADDPSNPLYDASQSTNAWNSTGDPMWVQRLSTGVYYVKLIGQNGGIQWTDFAGECYADKAGTTEVTAVGEGNAYCKIQKANVNKIEDSMVGEDTRIHVSCFDGFTGAPVDSMFTLIYGTLSLNGSPTGGYALANNPTASKYAALRKYRQTFKNTADGNNCPHCYPHADNAPTVLRLGVGRYSVIFSALADHLGNGSPYRVSAHVTAVGLGSETCKPSNFGGNGDNDVFVDVVCHTANGSPVDTRFMVNVQSQEWLFGN